MQKINTRSYISYKFTNSLYAGAAMGSIFVIYASLPPALFSAGGVALAFGGWILAFFYTKLIKLGTFFSIGLAIEIVTFGLTIVFLLFSFTEWIAFAVYCAYQIIFLFGNYLIRAETKLFSKIILLSIFDRAKQAGYLAGLTLSFLFYEALSFIGIEKSIEQILYIYSLLLVVQGVVLVLYLRAFKNLSAVEKLV